MKKKLIPLILALVCAIACAFGLAACGGSEFTATASLTTTEDQHVGGAGLVSKSIHTPGYTSMWLREVDDLLVFCFPEEYEQSGNSSSVTGTEITIRISFQTGWDPTGMVVLDAGEPLETTVYNDQDANKYKKELIAKITKSGERNLTLQGTPTPIVGAVALERILSAPEHLLDIYDQNILDNIQIKARIIGTESDPDWIYLRALTDPITHYETVIDFSVDSNILYLKLPQSYAKNSLSMVLADGKRMTYNEYFSKPSEGIYAYIYDIDRLGTMATPKFSFIFDRFENPNNY